MTPIIAKHDNGLPEGAVGVIYNPPRGGNTRATTDFTLTNGKNGAKKVTVWVGPSSWTPTGLLKAIQVEWKDDNSVGVGVGVGIVWLAAAEDLEYEKVWLELLEETAEHLDGDLRVDAKLNERDVMVNLAVQPGDHGELGRYLGASQLLVGKSR
ncbi:hypothetical protein CMQ_6448 [Grosmannia clavigera kw1407]|uniref:Uncharacterized protein n=1 Tax=Grosmannia clavigera (strain kw1407 / UAMH 11150) TaxID=655863 RepID=F0XLD6_GROCL|nr:uncharacterized protein CMQ_6448 [Grosmannia clavigera kw1407]EFX01506.1 hypothetical protein CMQ_6448 [Grosmannia clavigera kw1407]